MNNVYIIPTFNDDPEMYGFGSWLKNNAGNVFKTIGGAALLAKIIISNLIDEKIDKLEKNRLKSHSMMKVAGLVCRSIVRTRTGAYTT